jgi:hydrogenase small subunit
MSFLNSEQPGVNEFLSDFSIKILWHPSLSPESGDAVGRIIERCNKRNLDILVIEGAIAEGPEGTGGYDILAGRPFKDVVLDMAVVAEYVIAVGTCASWGGIPAADPNPTDATGLQFHKSKKGGLLGGDFVSNGGLPVINISGCPAHPEWMMHTLATLALGKASSIELDKYNRPMDFYSNLSHEGCTKGLYHEYKMAAENFGDKGCLFFELGCRGPITYSACNETMWNGRSSKPRAGVPCVGCTDPEFPDYPEQGFFRRYAITPKLGVKMLPYLISTPFAKLVAPGLNKRTEER